MNPVPSFFLGFAKKNRLRITRDECGDQVCKGRFGDIFVYSERKRLIGICLVNERKDGWPLKTAHKKNRLLRMRPDKCVLEGDVEGIWVTDPSDKEFIQTAKRVLKIPTVRRYSEEHREVLRKRLAKWRFERREETKKAVMEEVT